MSITEAKLLASGFTPSDLQKLRKYITKDALSLDIIWFFQPPFLSYKAWKIKKKYR